MIIARIRQATTAIEKKALFNQNQIPKRQAMMIVTAFNEIRILMIIIQILGLQSSSLNHPYKET